VWSAAAVQVWPQAVADTSTRYGNITSKVLSAGGPAANKTITAIHILSLPTSNGNSAGSNSGNTTSSAGGSDSGSSAGGNAGSTGSGSADANGTSTTTSGNGTADSTSSSNSTGGGSRSNSGSGGSRRLLQGDSTSGNGDPTVTVDGVTLRGDQGKVTFDSSKGVLKIEGLRNVRAGQPLNIAWQL
jgi:hypothetical protein